MIQFMDRCGFDDSVITPALFEKASILESCFDAVVNEEADYRIITTATAYTHSMFFEILENVKEALVKLAQRVLSTLNNYFLNSAKLLDKYREIIGERLDKVTDPIKQDTYEYPSAKDYPKSLKSTIGAEKDILRLYEKIRTYAISPAHISGQVNRLLQSFGKEVLERTPDPDDLKKSTAKIVQERIRGQKKTITITRDTFNAYVNEILNYKRDKDDIMRTRKSIIDDYEALKRTYATVTKDPESLMRSHIQNIKDPDREAFLAHEYTRYADIHMEMMRLFNGYIAIYQSAFDTKLQCLSEKIESNKAMITEIITRTGVFAAINTKAVNPVPRAEG